MKKVKAIIGFIMILVLPAQAMAYVGPGAGITMLGALWGVFIAILAALGAVLYWPIRSVIRKRKKRLAADAEANSNSSATAENGGDESRDDLSD